MDRVTCLNNQYNHLLNLRAENIIKKREAMNIFDINAYEYYEYIILLIEEQMDLIETSIDTDFTIP